jgi:hypothetical protein
VENLKSCLNEFSKNELEEERNKRRLSMVKTVIGGHLEILKTFSAYLL